MATLARERESLARKREEVAREQVSHLKHELLWDFFFKKNTRPPFNAKEDWEERRTSSTLKLSSSSNSLNSKKKHLSLSIKPFKFGRAWNRSCLRSSLIGSRKYWIYPRFATFVCAEVSKLKIWQREFTSNLTNKKMQERMQAMSQVVLTAALLWAVDQNDIKGLSIHFEAGKTQDWVTTS